MWRVLKVFPKNWHQKCGPLGCAQAQSSCEGQPVDNAETTSAKTTAPPVSTRPKTTPVDNHAADTKILSQVNTLCGQSKSLVPYGKRVSSHGGWRVPNWQSYNVLEALGIGFAILVGLRFGLRPPNGHRQDEPRKQCARPYCPLSALMRLAHAINTKSHLELPVLPETTVQNVLQPESTADAVTPTGEGITIGKVASDSQPVSFVNDKDPEERALADMQRLEDDFRAHVLNFEAQDLLKRRPHAAFEMFEEASELGLDRAMFNLGVCYENGLGIDQDLMMALEWYEEAASRGHSAALYNMAVFHLEGKGVPVDENLGLLCMRRACDAGVKEAQTYMGLQHGKNCEYDAAAALFQKSAFQKHAEGQYLLGLCYENGLGVEENAAKAAELFARAAQANNVDASYRLGTYYEMGLGGLIEDKGQAMELYKIAAAANHPMAMQRMEQDLNKIDNCDKASLEQPPTNNKPLRAVSSSPNLTTPDSNASPNSNVFDFTKVKEFIHDYLLHPGKMQLYRFHLNNINEQEHVCDLACTPATDVEMKCPVKAW